MRNFIFVLLMAMAIGVNAQVLEPVDSIDLETGVIYPANKVELVDTVSCDTIDLRNPPIPQIPLSECDSIVMIHLLDCSHHRNRQHQGAISEQKGDQDHVKENR